MTTKSKNNSTRVNDGRAPIFVTEEETRGPTYRAPRPAVFPMPEPDEANLYFHIAPVSDPADVETFEAIAHVTATAVVGEPVRVRIGSGEEVARLELMPTVHDCPTCRQPMPERVKKKGTVQGDTFVAMVPGRYRLRVVDSAGRFAFLHVGVVPREMVDHPFIAVVRVGPDRGAVRTPRERFSVARAFVRDKAGTGALEQLTSARPLPAGFAINLYGG